MQLGMIGLGRMGANMVQRLLRNGHECVVFDRSQQAVHVLVSEKATGAASLADFVNKLSKPRAVWPMVPAAEVDNSIGDLPPLLEPGDILIDGGNSYYADHIRHAQDVHARDIHYVDVGSLARARPSPAPACGGSARRSDSSPRAGASVPTPTVRSWPG